jgi:hypothetical protein
MNSLGTPSINYNRAIATLAGGSGRSLAKRLTEAFTGPRLVEYRAISQRSIAVVEFNIDDCTFLFDYATSIAFTGAPKNSPEDRVVVVYGFSRPAPGARDASRMAGFLRDGGMKSVA